MRNAVFVAPFFMEATLRFVDAVADLPDTRTCLISQDPVEKLPPALRAKLNGHYRVPDALDPAVLRRAVEAIVRTMGCHTDRIIGTLEELQVPLGVVRDELGIEGLGAEAARNFRDKARMKAVLSRNGVPCARHVLAPNPQAALHFAETAGYPLVVKPPAGAGARGTFRVDDAQALAECLRVAQPSAERPALIEEFMTGYEHSFDSVCLDGKLIWHSVNHYFPGPLEVLRNPWIQWCVLSPREVDDPRYKDIRDAAARALSALGMGTGLSHMEWFRRPDGRIAVSEVGARPPGARFMTLISYAQDLDLYRAWARLMVHGEFAAPPRPYAAGAAYMRGQGHGRVKAIHGLDQAQRELGDLVVEVRLPKFDQPPSGTYEGDGYVILRHPETATVERALHRLVQLIRVELG
jgi:formate-dependent phosphoribosylglycinamide formyltransferase (GAR transformylase)